MQQQQLLDTADNVRRKVASHTSIEDKAELGQFMTPSNIARFMASLFPPSFPQNCHLLDAGAGVGALSCAFIDRWITGGFDFTSIDVTAYEVDEKLIPHLEKHLSEYENLTSKVIEGDYIELATKEGLHNRGYTHIILNPPYKRINSKSAHRLALRTVGIETVNLYSAFVALAIGEAALGGQIVAIVPRSFCNGPYYRPFRDFILEHSAIRHMHLFESRDKAFKDDKVLQENVIIHLERGGEQGNVTVSTSTDDSFSDLEVNEHPFDRIVFPDDSHRFIHVPTTTEKSAIELLTRVSCSLTEIEVEVSTGPVVDFRVKEHLRDMPEQGSVPLIYPLHLGDKGANWPIEGLRKPNAIMSNEMTAKWLYPNGFYCVVRRFSSKEEKRRVVARTITPDSFESHAMLGFENHLNVFHVKKQGLSEMLARGLATFLNSTAVDEYFRRFNGHTQVNVTDLRMMKYPNQEILIELGEWSKSKGVPTQEEIDVKLGEIAI